MDLRTFIVELAKALGWPVAVIIILLLLRGNVRALVALVQRVKWRDFEVYFGQELDHAKANAARLPAAQLPAGKLDAKFRQIWELVDDSPRAAIVESWVLVERAIEKLFASRKQPVAKLFPRAQLAELLSGQGLLTRESVGLIDNLRGLRNKLVHAPEEVAPTNNRRRSTSA